MDNTRPREVKWVRFKKDTFPDKLLEDKFGELLDNPLFLQEHTRSYCVRTLFYPHFIDLWTTLDNVEPYEPTEEEEYLWTLLTLES